MILVTKTSEQTLQRGHNLFTVLFKPWAPCASHSARACACMCLVPLAVLSEEESIRFSSSLYAEVRSLGCREVDRLVV